MDTGNDIQLAGSGPITWRNHRRLGYVRLTRGVYGRPPNSQSNEYQARRARFIAHAQAVMAAYEGRLIVPYGPTALQILGVALPAGLEDWQTCHVLVPKGSYRPIRRGVLTHCTGSDWQVWTTRHGIPVLHPVDHWLQMQGTDDELIEVADGMMRRQHPLISLAEFRHRLDELAGTSGVRRARRLMRWVVPGTDSIYESRTRLILVRAGLPTPAVNCAVPCRSGFTYHTDMGYEIEKVAVEYDGQVHKDQIEIDAQRRRDLQDEGWLIITVTAKQLQHPVDIVRSVEAALVMRRAALARELRSHVR